MSRRLQARPGECTLLNIQLLPSTSQRSRILKCEQDDGARGGGGRCSCLLGPQSVAEYLLVMAVCDEGSSGGAAVESVMGH